MKNLYQSLLKQASQALVFIVVTFLSIYHITAFAQANGATTTNISHTNSRTSVVQDTQTQQASQRASEWGLKSEEWQRYEELMQGRLGIYSPGVDPLTALGIEARSDEERRHYAELQVQAEAARVERELAYQKAYDEAFKRLFPELMPLMGMDDMGGMRDMEGSAGIATVISGSSNRLVVFVQNDCLPCEQKIQQLQSTGIGFDLYMVGSNLDDAVIRRWATKAGIDPQKVLSRSITLNHDAGKWQAIITHSGLDADLPAVLREVGGKWLRQ